MLIFKNNNGNHHYVPGTELNPSYIIPESQNHPAKYILAQSC